MNDHKAAAEKARLTNQIRSFMTWLGEGRKLTQTGRIGLADARHLVVLLDTGDTIDPAIGDRVFKTKSSEELTSLTRIMEWMKAARLVRVTGTRLVPVKKNAHLVDRPLDVVLALLKAYPRLGKSLFPRNAWRQSLIRWYGARCSSRRPSICPATARSWCLPGSVLTGDNVGVDDVAVDALRLHRGEAGFAEHPPRRLLAPHRAKAHPAVG